jgi:hypothetical protein
LGEFLEVVSYDNGPRNGPVMQRKHARKDAAKANLLKPTAAGLRHRVAE